MTVTLRRNRKNGFGLHRGTEARWKPYITKGKVLDSLFLKKKIAEEGQKLKHWAANDAELAKHQLVYGNYDFKEQNIKKSVLFLCRFCIA